MNNKRMMLRMMGTCLVAALPCLASADAPGDMAAGEVDAILKFCARSDHRLEENAEKLRKLLAHSFPPGAQSSAGYKQGYDLVSDALEHADRTKVQAACTAGLTVSGDHREARLGHHGDREGRGERGDRGDRR